MAEQWHVVSQSSTVHSSNNSTSTRPTMLSPHQRSTSIDTLPGESKQEFTNLAGNGTKSMLPIFKIEVLIYESKANLDQKILFGKITHLQDPTVRKMPVRGLYGIRGFHVPFWSMIYVALKFIWSVSEIEFQFQ